VTLPYAEVIGDPIAHSKSPMIHGFWLEQAGITADYRATHVTAGDLPAYFAARREDPDWRGTNVTIPHKQAVMPYLDAIDPAAQRIGAVNTVRPENGRLIGYNTDAAGFLEPLRPWLAQQHLFRMARIMGAGGAALAVAHGLAGRGFTIVVAARDIEKARALRSGIGAQDDLATTLDTFARPLAFDWGDRSGVLDVFVNATSLGMKGYPPLEIDFSNMPPGAIVYDIVYAPLETPLLAEARRRGHPVIDGLSMLVGQAAEAFTLFFRAAPPRERDAELRARLTA
jgi:shikimate dehydrogenase